MTEELRKKLRDAGFEQTHEYYDDGRFCAKCGNSTDSNYRESYGKPCEPSLNELIEGCGDDFHSLVHLIAIGKWRASGFKDEDVFDADTPEQAVANLWLKLNKK